jgi:hypothetical protein
VGSRLLGFPCFPYSVISRPALDTRFQTHNRREAPFWEDVYRIPILGGQATRVLEDVDAPLSFIDGGQRVCFYRQNFAAGTYQFLSASAEGGDEQVLATGKKPFLQSPVCAPNGRFAVFWDPLGVQSLDFDSGRKQTLASSTTLGGWISELHWASGGEGLFAIRGTNRHPNNEIGFLSYPGGKWRKRRRVEPYR